VTVVKDTRASGDTGPEFEYRVMIPTCISKTLEPHSFRYRRRECVDCGKKFKTVELDFDALIEMLQK
jgi:hypothetical protein